MMRIEKWLDVEWRWTLAHAWSFRLWALACALDLLQTLLQYVSITVVPGWVVGGTVWLLGVAGLIARLVAQKEE
jgi:hypothetical protein